MSPALDSVIPVPQKQAYRVALLVPAHNEEEGIQNTVLSLLKQTACNLPDVQVDVFIIADNCTDRTEKIILALIQGLKSQEEKHPVFLLRTKNNTSRKAGALNQGYRKIRKLGYTHIATA